MASLFGKCWNNFVLLAAAVLWAGCSDGDKNADKTLEQEKGKTEQSLDVKKEDYEKAHRDRVLKIIADVDESLRELKRNLTGKTLLYGCPPGEECIVERDENGDYTINGNPVEKDPSIFVETPFKDELKLASSDDSDKALILKTIRSRAPGFRIVYHRHLKKKPVFSGTIVLRLNINADGTVQKVQIDSTTTGNRAFDEDVQKAVSYWKFPKMNSDEVATFPIRFYEEELLKQND